MNVKKNGPVKTSPWRKLRNRTRATGEELGDSASIGKRGCGFLKEIK